MTLSDCDYELYCLSIAANSIVHTVSDCDYELYCLSIAADSIVDTVSDFDYELYCLSIAADSIVHTISFVRCIVVYCENKFIKFFPYPARISVSKSG